MRTVYIYGLWDCRDGRLRYIGKTMNPTYRLWRHTQDYDNGKITHCSTWVKGLLNDGLEPLMEILEECTEDNWREAEREWIAKAREFGLDLVNMHPGGTGGAIPGVPKSERFKKHLSEKFKGRPGYWKGRKHTEESKDKVRRAKLGKERPEMLGRKLTEEHKAKIGAGNAKALKGRKISDEEKERLRQVAIDRWNRKGERDRQREKTSDRVRNEKGQFV